MLNSSREDEALNWVKKTKSVSLPTTLPTLKQKQNTLQFV